MADHPAFHQQFPDGKPGMATGNPGGLSDTSSMPAAARKEAASPSSVGTTPVGNKATTSESESARDHADASQNSALGSKNAGSDNTELT